MAARALEALGSAGAGWIRLPEAETGLALQLWAGGVLHALLGCLFTFGTNEPGLVDGEFGGGGAAAPLLGMCLCRCASLVLFRFILELF